jgi:hypothetical protein
MDPLPAIPRPPAIDLRSASSRELRPPERYFCGASVEESRVSVT